MSPSSVIDDIKVAPASSLAATTTVPLHDSSPVPSPLPSTSTSTAPSPTATPPPSSPPRKPVRVPRSGPQPLADVLVSEELIAGAPSKNGGRLLTSDRDPWSHNAWDKVEWDDEQQRIAEAAVERQRLAPVAEELQREYNANPARQWDTFYDNVKGRSTRGRARRGMWWRSHDC